MDYIARSLFQYVFDSSSPIDIERNKRMNCLRKRHAEVILPEKVAEEVKQPRRSPLKTFIDRYPNVVTEFTPAEEEQYLRMVKQRGIDEGLHSSSDPHAHPAGLRRQRNLLAPRGTSRDGDATRGARIRNRWQARLAPLAFGAGRRYIPVGRGEHALPAAQLAGRPSAECGRRQVLPRNSLARCVCHRTPATRHADSVCAELAAFGGNSSIFDPDSSATGG